MSYPEHLPGIETATPAQLERLYGTAREWLIYNGMYRHGEYGGEVGGLPIFQDGERFECEIDGDVLRKVLPDEATALAVGTKVELTHERAYVEPTSNPTAFNYQHPSYQVFIHKSPDSGVISEFMYVNPTEEGGWRSSKVSEYPEVPAPRPSVEIDPEEHIDAIQHLWGMEEETGLTRLTRDECAALQTIVDHLDILVQG